MDWLVANHDQILCNNLRFVRQYEKLLQFQGDKISKPIKFKKATNYLRK